jgi:hypothetical protein
MILSYRPPPSRTKALLQSNCDLTSTALLSPQSKTHAYGERRHRRTSGFGNGGSPYPYPSRHRSAAAGGTKNQICVHSAGNTYIWACCAACVPKSHSILTTICLQCVSLHPCSRHAHCFTYISPLLFTFRSPRTPLTRRTAAQAPAAVATGMYLHLIG